MAPFARRAGLASSGACGCKAEVRPRSGLLGRSDNAADVRARRRVPGGICQTGPSPGTAGSGRRETAAPAADPSARAARYGYGPRGPSPDPAGRPTRLHPLPGPRAAGPSVLTP
ncbi:hypothetical protein GCM10012287_24470 [Streptomyces daqingensis]|uniref:Uncharacterized protein n=1 Tax=Streptomyces daqingensis TaxID=1472640 RepID=A0ABQ2MAN0_9ACTN|nr:hypothetical protein GCM10012287_24470 [Streptomyces daqingensis]